jgi:hypothetical protein
MNLKPDTIKKYQVTVAKYIQALESYSTQSRRIERIVKRWQKYADFLSTPDK